MKEQEKQEEQEEQDMCQNKKITTTRTHKSHSHNKQARILFRV